MLPDQTHKDFKTGIENDWDIVGVQLRVEIMSEWKDCDVEGFWNKQILSEGFFLEIEREKNALRSGGQNAKNKDYFEIIGFSRFFLMSFMTRKRYVTNRFCLLSVFCLKLRSHSFGLILPNTSLFLWHAPPDSWELETLDPDAVFNLISYNGFCFLGFAQPIFPFMYIDSTHRLLLQGVLLLNYVTYRNIFFLWTHTVAALDTCISYLLVFARVDTMDILTLTVFSMSLTFYTNLSCCGVF